MHRSKPLIPHPRFSASTYGCGILEPKLLKGLRFGVLPQLSKASGPTKSSTRESTRANETKPFNPQSDMLMDVENRAGKGPVTLPKLGAFDPTIELTFSCLHCPLFLAVTFNCQLFWTTKTRVPVNHPKAIYKAVWKQAPELVPLLQAYCVPFTTCCGQFGCKGFVSRSHLHRHV